MRSLVFMMLLVLSTAVFAGEYKRPNIVVMMVDNLGWGELGSYGGGELRGAATPVLDKLASEGMRFLNFNVETQCTPSRSAFMTGRHPIRSGTTKVVFGVPYGLTQWEITLPELLHEAGYATAIFGKWHLGDYDGRFPTDQGFDEWYGIANTTDETMYSANPNFDASVTDIPSIYESKRGQKARAVADFDLKTRPLIDAEISRRAVKYISKKAKKDLPFFAFVSFTNPHFPVMPHPDFDGKTGNGRFADVLAELDHRSGEVLQAVERSGIKDNTVVIWLSDNGPDPVANHHGTSGYWRGSIFTALEGSLRTPAMIRWPQKIKAGRVSNEIIHIADIMPTLANIAGYKVPQDRMIDGVDQLAFLLGKEKISRREGFPVFNGDELYAYKWRNYKYHLVEQDSMFSNTRRSIMGRFYNLITDPKEMHSIEEDDLSNVWAARPIAKRILDFQRSLMVEPPIATGTRDPYRPGGGR